MKAGWDCGCVLIILSVDEWFCGRASAAFKGHVLANDFSRSNQ
jgi:hypothetical protein